MALLITPTLLDAYDWFNKAPKSWKEKAFKDLENKLNRAKWDPTPAIKRGIDFENKIYTNCNRPAESFKASQIFKEVCDECRGGNFQKTIKKIIVVDGVEYLLYGKTDAYFPEVIKDIKTTKNYKGAKKYLGGWQHIIYSYVSGIKNFKYVVVEWSDEIENDNDLVPGDLFLVDYTMEDRDENKRLITEKIRDFIEFIESDEELNTAYRTIFNKYG